MTGNPVVPPVQPVSRRVRVLLALVAGGIYCAVLALALVLPTGSGYTRPIDHWSPDNPRFLSAHTRVGSVPLPATPKPGGGYEYRLNLVETGPFPLGGLRSVGFKFDVLEPHSAPNAGIPTEAKIMSAQLLSRGGSVEFRGSVGTLETEQILQLSSPGWKLEGAVASTNWELSISTAVPVELRLRCHITSAAEVSTLSTNVGAFAVILGDGKRFAYPHGVFVYDGDSNGESTTRRVDMLAWAWAWDSPERVFRWLGVSFLAFLLAFAVLPIGFDPLEGIRPARIAIGTASLFFAFGLGQLVLTPPFFGTDEASHFFSYHRWMGDTKTTDAALVEGRRLHSARMLLRPEQKLAHYDQEHPWWWFIDNPLTIDTRPAARSATTARLWESSRHWFVARTPLSMLFRLRLMSLLTFCLGAGLAAATLASTVPRDEWSPWLGWTPFLVPSLPYFAMNYSNYPTLFGGFAVLAAAMASSLATPVRSWWVGGIIGLAAGFVFHTSQSAFPAVVFIFAGLFALATGRLFRPEEVESPKTPSVGFWMFLGAGLLAARLLNTPEFDAEAGLRLANARDRLQGLTWLTYPVGAIAVCLGGCLLETMAIWLRGRWSIFLGRTMGYLGFGMAAVVVVGVAWNSIGRVPHLEPLNEVIPSWEYVPNQRNVLPLYTAQRLPDVSPRVREYDLAAARAVFGSFGMGEHDFMASRLFWIVGGYLDCEAPEFWISILSTLFAGGFAVLAWGIGRHRDGERIWILAGLLLGLAAYLALVATASVTAFSKPSLHGRYLIGFYLCFLTLGFSGFRRFLAVKSASRPVLVAALAVGIPVAHQLTLVFAQLDRYYN